MSEETKITDAVTTPVEEKKQEVVVPIDEQTAFQIKLQEFDRDIAVAEHKVTEVKAQKANWVYTSNIEMIARKHQENQLRQQTETEIRQKMSVAKADATA